MTSVSGLRSDRIVSAQPSRRRTLLRAHVIVARLGAPRATIWRPCGRLHVRPESPMPGGCQVGDGMGASVFEMAPLALDVRCWEGGLAIGVAVLCAGHLGARLRAA
jgi:hypothetical protein